MLKARRANRVLRIDEAKTEEFRALGYTITDMNGNVISTPEDDKSHIKALEDENAQLRARLAELESAAAKEKAKAKEEL